MARITFVYPDFENLGIEYLMAACLKDGHKICFVPYHAEDADVGKKRSVSFQALAKKIAATRPHIAAFSCVTDNYGAQLDSAKAVKKASPDTITFFGGVHPTAVPENVLRESAVDCVAIGEAEESFPAFLKKCKIDKACILPGEPVEGIVYKKDGEIVGEFREGNLPDLNALPFPHKDPLFRSSLGYYFSYEYRTITSRGCPYSCSYCFNSYMRSLRGKSVLRQRSVDNVIAELAWAKKAYSPKYVVFLDDSFATNEKWIYEFCERYKKEIALPFGCISIPYHLNDEKVKMLSSAGCRHMQIGVQSTNKEICTTVLQRKSDNAKIAEAVKMLRKTGIAIQLDHMLGIPGDTLEFEEKSALFYNEYRPHIISVFWLTYYPKTAIIGTAKRMGILTDNDISLINEGKKITESTFHFGGSMKNPKAYLGISFLLHYIPLLPKFLVRFIVKKRLYKMFSTNNYFVSTVLPRTLLSIINRNNFRDRGCIVRFVNKIFSRE